MSMTMLGHYVASAIRSSRQDPFGTTVKLLVLALGLACFLFTWSVVTYWSAAERGFSRSGRTHVITTRTQLGNGFDSGFNPGFTARAGAEELREAFPEFEAVARARSVGETPLEAGGRRLRLQVAYADPQFLDIFDLRFLAGAVANTLARPQSAILTQAAATRLFGMEPAVGRTVRFGGLVDVTVTGVVADIAQPSHLGASPGAVLQFDVLASWDVGARLRQGPAPGSNSFLSSSLTYVMLREDAAVTAQALVPRLQQFSDVAPDNSLVKRSYGLVPVRELVASRLNAEMFTGLQFGVSLPGLLLCLGVAVLVVSCINYINLATAQVRRRAKEIGLRKAIGARGTQIAVQYLVEAAVLTAAAFILAVLAVSALAPGVRASTGIDIGLVLHSGGRFWLIVLCALAGCVIFSGAYPAFVLSRVLPLQALRSAENRQVWSSLPGFLVGIQFAAASFLLIVVSIMQQQQSHLRSKGPGLTADPLAVIANVRTFTGLDSRTLQDELRRLPDVAVVAGMSRAPWSTAAETTGFQLNPVDASTVRTAATMGIDFDFLATMGIEVLFGRGFERDRADTSIWKDLDVVNPASLVVDEAFTRQMGFATPDLAVGQLVYLQVNDDRQPVRIVGVVENRPLFFTAAGSDATAYYIEESPAQILVRLEEGRVAEGLKAISGIWSQLAPRDVLQIEFEDRLFARGQALFRQLSAAFTGLAVVACLICVFGLVGMAGHMTGRRRREIGVRKTLGATTRGVLRQLLWEFFTPVVLASLAAWPFAYVAAGTYLNVFIDRTSLSPVPFVLGLCTTLGIAWLAVGGQALKAARMKPALVLRAD